jgi:ubiquinone/menaquinone biosynthesis C-methylase UbiE
MKPATTEDILDLMDAGYISAAVGAAMELGLFWLLEKNPMTAQEVADTLRIPPRRCQYWLQLLDRIGLIEKAGNGYALSSTARTAVLDVYGRESWALLAKETRERMPAIQNLPRDLRRPGSVWADREEPPPDYISAMSSSSESARRFTRMLYEVHRPLADALARFLDLKGVDRMMDLGGGSGVVSMALLARNPNLSAVVVDIPNVCEAGRKIAGEGSMANRISYHAADFQNDDLPSEFDMVLECDVNVYGEELFRKIRKAMKSGGRFVIVDQFAPEPGVAPPSRIHWALEGSMEKPDFSYPTAEDVQTHLRSVGFRDISLCSFSVGVGPVTRFSEDLTVIEASS